MFPGGSTGQTFDVILRGSLLQYITTNSRRVKHIQELDPQQTSSTISGSQEFWPQAGWSASALLYGALASTILPDGWIVGDGQMIRDDKQMTNSRRLLINAWYVKTPKRGDM